jgi:subtilisin family serine protease
MKKLLILSLTFICFFSTLLSADNISTLDVGNNLKIEYVPGELLVKYKPQVRNMMSSFYKNNWNISTIQTFKSIGCQHVKLPQGMTVEQALDMYRNDPDVEYAEPNYIYHATLTPNDTSFNELWGLHNIGQNVNGTSGSSDADIDATEAWDVVTGGTVIIAVIDSGVKYDHEDLAGNIWSNPGEIPGNGVDDDGNGRIDDIRGWDFVDDDNDPMDYNNHGTHVAGTIAAVGNNGLGVTGVCWTATIMPIRGLDAAGSGDAANLLSAIEYANDNGADVINNSWGGGPYSQPLKDAIDASTAVVVCAAGNSNVDNDATPHYPSSYTSTNIISVAATDQNDNRASFSNYGATSVDVGAPGVNIYSTITTRHDEFNDNFSGGLGNWTSGGTNNTWAISSSYLDESPGVDYVINTNSWIMTTLPISLAGEVGIRLEFLLQGISELGWDFLFIDL